jgi:hypothetical protein
MEVALKETVEKKPVLNFPPDPDDLETFNLSVRKSGSSGSLARRALSLRYGCDRRKETRDVRLRVSS